jgi:hypothetical protein
MADKKTPENARIGRGKAGPGRPKGKANGTTIAVREAIARVLEDNVENFSRWLAAVAEGEKEAAAASAEGKTDTSWIRKPDPGLALKLAMDMAEYHIPKLARTEISGELGIRGKLIISD